MPTESPSRNTEQIPLLSAAEVATWLSVDLKTLVKLPIPRIRVGRNWKYQASDVQDYLDRQQQGAA